MKKIFVWLLVLVLVLVSVLAGCEPVEEPGELGETPGAYATIASKWSSGNLVFYDKSSGNTIMTLDGTNEDVEITTATITTAAITGGTATALTITTLTAPTITGTTDLGDLVADNVSITGGTVSGLTYSGTHTINDIVADNITVTGGSMTGVTVTAASPTITGTMSNANVAMGQSDNCSSGSVVVTHGLSGTPTIVVATPDTAANNDSGWYVTSINGTAFTVTHANGSYAGKFYWVAWVAGE